MLSRVGSKLGTGAAILIGGAVGHQLKKHHEAGYHISEKSQKPAYTKDTSLLCHKELQNGRTINDIFRSLQHFASTSASRNPIAESHAENAKLVCQRFLASERLEVGGPDVWLSEWLCDAEWVDAVDWWPPPPARSALTPPSYTVALACGTRALWYISCCRDVCKGNSVFTCDLLRTLKEVIDDNSKAAPMALKVVANVAVHPEHHPHIRDAGLIDVLVACADHHHPYIFLPAWRALHNLKAGAAASKHTEVFTEGIYPFVLPQDDKTPVLDIVLVHGIEGGAPWTWRQSDADTDRPLLPQNLRREIGTLRKEVVDQHVTFCWPSDWLVPALDIPVRVVALDFQARWWKWGCDSPIESNGKSLPSHSREMREALREAGVGKRPVVWIAHSMGGLLVKHMLREDMQEIDSLVDASADLYPTEVSGGSLSRQTRAAVFCSVPHHGSSLATQVTTWPLSLLLQPTCEIWQMRTDNPVLRDIHESFLSLAKEREVAVLSLTESEPTSHSLPFLNLHFVVPHDADPGVGELCVVKTTHRDICKPADRKAEVYQKILHFLKQTVEQL